MKYINSNLNLYFVKIAWNITTNCGSLLFDMFELYFIKKFINFDGMEIEVTWKNKRGNKLIEDTASKM